MDANFTGINFEQAQEPFSYCAEGDVLSSAEIFPRAKMLDRTFSRRIFSGMGLAGVTAWSSFYDERYQMEGLCLLNVNVKPLYQTIHEGYRRGFEGDLTLPFKSWTPEQEAQVIGKIRKFSIPIEDQTLKKILHLITKFQRELCEEQSIAYPARFSASSWIHYDAENQRRQQMDFEIEVHTSGKAILVFKEGTSINKGTYKKVFRAFEVSLQPKIIAYAESLVSEKLTNTISRSREEQCFKLFQGEPWIAEAYGIYTLEEKESQQRTQIIEMKLYERDLYEAFFTKDISFEVRFDWCLQLMRAIDCMHQNDTIYRDLKLENVLVEGDKIFLTDFGYSAHCDDQAWLAKRVGTQTYFSPELILNKKCSFPVDIWAAGCLFWIALISPVEDCLYPWYSALSSKKIDGRKALEQILRYDQEEISDEISIANLIRKMLRFNPENRLTPRQVIEELEKIS